MDKIYISVIVTAFNVAKYLKECVDSIAGQTLSKIEIIVVDDGSTDDTYELAQLLASEDKRITVIHQDNQGVSAARNTGIRASQGDYIAFVDGDDFVAKDIYEKLLRVAEKEGSELVLCNYAKTDTAGNVIRNNIYAKDENATVREALSWINRPHGWTYVVVWNRLYKRELFDDLLFEPGKIHEDEIIAHKIYAKCNCISSISDVLYYYRSNPGSITGKKNIIKHIDGFNAVRDRYWDYKKWGYSELLRGTVECSKQFLAMINSFKVESDSDKDEIRKMKKDFRLMVKDLGNKAGIINNIIAISPELYYWFRKVLRGEK